MPGRYVAPILSHHKHALVGHCLLVSFNEVCIQITSIAADVIALYSILVLDLDTIAYFLALQETKFEPTNTTKPFVDLLPSHS